MGIDSKICPSCKEKNNPSFQKCWKCGADLMTGERSPAEASLKGVVGGVEKKISPEAKKLVVFFLVLTLLIGLAVGHRFFIYKPEIKNEKLEMQQKIIETKQDSTESQIANLPPGLVRKHYALGQLASEGVYKNGKKEGLFKWYDENGRLYEEAVFKSGMLEGEVKKYDENGRLKKEEVKGRPSGGVHQSKIDEKSAAMESQIVDLPDKVEEIITPTGQTIIKIRGQKGDLYYRRIWKEQESKAKSRDQDLNEPERDKFCSVSLPVVSPTISENNSGGGHWYLIETEHFIVEVENNETFGVFSAEKLEALALLVKQEMRFGADGALNRKGKFKVKIFESKSQYDNYCQKNNLSCDGTVGITHARYRANFVEDEIVFFWDKDWRKFWDDQQLTAQKRTFYETLFHEATHQILNTYGGFNYPNWLSEGLAVYFSKAFFNGKEIYLPGKFINPYAIEIKEFLGRGGNPGSIFSWRGADPNSQGAFYGLSGSLVFIMMRRPSHRHYLDTIVEKIKAGLSRDEATDFLAKSFSEDFWNEWLTSLKEMNL